MLDVTSEAVASRRLVRFRFHESAMSREEQFEAWCRRLRASDRSAFAAVFRALHDALFRYAYFLIHDRTAAHDLVQEAFLELWRMRTRLDPDRSLEALLYRIMRNRAYNRQRNRRTRAARRADLRRESALDHEGPPLPDAALDARALEERLRAWIDELPARQRESLLLSRYEGMSHEEVAAVMGISPRTVNNHIVRALKTLRERLDAFEPDLLQP